MAGHTETLLFRMVDHGTTLATRRRGSECAQSLRELAPRYDDVILDFAGVDIVTAPFLSEFLSGVREILRDTDPEGAPIVVAANASDEITEELELVLEHRRVPLAILRDDGVDLLHARPHLKATFQEALTLPPPFTTTQLADRLSLEGTAVNERLRPLLEAGALSRRPDPNATRGVRHLHRAPDSERLRAHARTPD